jgi:hypothetical protein
MPEVLQVLQVELSLQVRHVDGHGMHTKLLLGLVPEGHDETQVELLRYFSVTPEISEKQDVHVLLVLEHVLHG